MTTNPTRRDFLRRTAGAAAALALPVAVAATAPDASENPYDLGLIPAYACTNPPSPITWSLGLIRGRDGRRYSLSGSWVDGVETLLLDGEQVTRAEMKERIGVEVGVTVEDRLTPGRAGG